MYCILSWYFAELVTTDTPTATKNKDSCLEAELKNLTDGTNKTCSTVQQLRSNAPSNMIIPLVNVTQTCIPPNGSVHLWLTLGRNHTCDGLHKLVYVWRHAIGCKNSDRLVPCLVKNAVIGERRCEIMCPCSQGTASLKTNFLQLSGVPSKGV